MNRKVIIVVPTVRGESIKTFLSSWEKEFAEIQLMVVEDNAEPTFDISGNNIEHYSWQDIDRDLGEDAWILPRKTDCVRSYGYWKAYNAGADIIITLDDDCLPMDLPFVEKHIHYLQARSEDLAWLSTLDGQKPRGYPYFNNHRAREIVLNHGLWTNVPDLDAPTQLLSARQSMESSLLDQTIPVGKFYPMCGMNLAFKKKVAPALYFLLMGKDYPYDRFGDIWAGILSKKIIDHLGMAVHSGPPFIEHRRASDVWINLRKESPGLPVNEEFWQVVDGITLTKTTFRECYRELAEKLPLNGEYWDKLKRAMITWSELFQ